MNIDFTAMHTLINITLPSVLSILTTTEHAVFNSELVTVRQESVEMEIPPAIREESVEVQIPPAIHEESVEVVIPPAPCF